LEYLIVAALILGALGTWAYGNMGIQTAAMTNQAIDAIP